ncbi:citrate synthase [Reyranella soli]|uniref:citrate synthase (unknown stereospecificity) n=1 Tax=Reyranella soli TaxID=1230389 RepID=A0A512N7N7_9HYPH|nr:citrate synthase [Reyranella soli]GEP54997.1 citrate synthase [Reyranella soli]
MIRKPSRTTAAGRAHDAKSFLSAKEAAHLLRIKPQTLYAYVSRGWIHSIGQDKRHGFLYSREDVERLRARGHAKAEGGLYKGGAPRWSEPIVQTSITTITPAGPAYRGHAALDLARHKHSFESVAELLWSGAWMEEQGAWPGIAAAVAMDKLVASAEVDASQPDIVKLFSLFVTSLVARPSGGDDLRDGNTVIAARALLMGLPACMGFLARSRKSIAPDVSASGNELAVAARIVAGAGARASAETTSALNAALVLLADHELTPQTVAARLAASSGANLYFCILSALSVHSGSRIRRACDKVEDLLATARASTRHDRLAEMARSGSAIPGFNHPLYPNGDPRAEYLLAVARSQSINPDRTIDIVTFLEEAAQELKVRPSVETGLVVLCHALQLPYRSAGAILTIARCAGWIAHVMEQRLAGIMLRPRARYLVS